MRALGIESAYSLVDLVGEERALADPAGSLADARRPGGPDLVALRAVRPRCGSRGITPAVTELGLSYVHRTSEGAAA